MIGDASVHEMGAGHSHKGFENLCEEEGVHAPNKKGAVEPQSRFHPSLDRLF